MERCLRMIITKYPQSCLLVEAKGRKILVDPGTLLWDDSFLKDWADVDAIFVTHKHSDHCNAAAISAMQVNNGMPVYSSSEVATKYTDINFTIIKIGDILDLDVAKVEVVNAVHGYLPTIKGSETTENLGFIIDDDATRFYITGDTICFDNDYKCDVIAVPVSDMALVMGPYEAVLFAKAAGAKTILPTHWDHPTYPVDMGVLKKYMDVSELDYKILGVRENIEF